MNNLDGTEDVCDVRGSPEDKQEDEMREGEESKVKDGNYVKSQNDSIDNNESGNESERDNGSFDFYPHNLTTSPFASVVYSPPPSPTPPKIESIALFKTQSESSPQEKVIKQTSFSTEGVEKIDSCDEATKPTTENNNHNISLKIDTDIKNSTSVSDEILSNTITPTTTNISKDMTRKYASSPTLSSLDHSHTKIMKTQKQKPDQQPMRKKFVHVGILCKRRDVFRGQWPRRLFVLNEWNGLLQYYIVPKKLYQNFKQELLQIQVGYWKTSSENNDSPSPQTPIRGNGNDISFSKLKPSTTSSFSITSQQSSKNELNPLQCLGEENMDLKDPLLIMAFEISRHREPRNTIHLAGCQIIEHVSVGGTITPNEVSTPDPIVVSTATNNIAAPDSASRPNNRHPFQFQIVYDAGNNLSQHNHDRNSIQSESNRKVSGAKNSTLQKLQQAELLYGNDVSCQNNAISSSDAVSNNNMSNSLVDANTGGMKNKNFNNKKIDAPQININLSAVTAIEYQIWVHAIRSACSLKTPRNRLGSSRDLIYSMPSTPTRSNAELEDVTLPFLKNLLDHDQLAEHEKINANNNQRKQQTTTDTVVEDDDYFFQNVPLQLRNQIRHTMDVALSLLSDNETHNISAADEDTDGNESEKSNGKQVHKKNNKKIKKLYDDSFAQDTSVEERAFIHSTAAAQHSTFKSHHGRRDRRKKLRRERSRHWRHLLDRKGVKAYKKKQGGNFLIKTESIVNFPSHVFFNLVQDLRQKPSYEHNVNKAKRLKQYNYHTFLDYYANIKTMRLAAPRDYCVISHWRMLPENRILYLSFSSHDPNYSCPERHNYVRANLVISAWLISPIINHEASLNLEGSGSLNECCEVKRIFCADLNGRLPSKVVNIGIRQQALLPFFMNRYLHRRNNLKFERPKQRPKLKRIQSQSSSNGVKGERSLLSSCESQRSLNSVTKGNINLTNEYLIQEIINKVPLSAMNSDCFVPTAVNIDDEEDDHDYQSEDEELYINSDDDDNDQTDEDYNEDAEDELDSLSESSSSSTLSDLSVQEMNPKDEIQRGIVRSTKSFPNTSGMEPKNSQLDEKNQMDRYKDTTKYSLEFLFTTLLLPVLSWFLLNLVCPACRELVFLFAIFLSYRRIIQHEFGEPLYYDSNFVSTSPLVGCVNGHASLGTGQVTSRFSVHLKGVLRFIEHKKEENREASLKLQQQTFSNSADVPINIDESTIDNVEISVTHIVAKAVAIALSEKPSLNIMKVIFPSYLFLPTAYYLRENIDISVISGIHCDSIHSNQTFLLKHVDKLSIQGVANQLYTNQKNRNDAFSVSQKGMEKNSGLLSFVNRVFSVLYNTVVSTSRVISLLSEEEGISLSSFPGKRFGSCVILTSPNSQNQNVEIDVAPCVDLGVNIVVVIGGLYLVPKPGGEAEPMLNVSVTINNPATNIPSCRSFTEKIQELLQFPELCDM